MDTEYEFVEGESESEAAEARRWTPPRRASGAGLYKPPVKMNGAGVSQTQLAAAMARVGDQLKQNSAAVSTVNSRVNTVSGAEKKDNEKREKDIKGINEKIQLLTLLPLLIRPPTYTIPAQSITDTAGDTSPANALSIGADPTSPTNALLPLLLIGGMGGSGGLGSSSDGSMDSTTLLILALVLSGGIH